MLATQIKHEYSIIMHAYTDLYNTRVIWIGITYLNGRFFVITNGHITEFSKIVMNIDCSTTTSIVMFKHAEKYYFTNYNN